MIPLPLVFTFLRSNWKLIAIGLAVLSLTIYIGVLKHQVRSAKDDLASEKAHSLALETQNQAYVRTIQTQNESIAAYEKASRDSQARSSAMLEKARKDTKDSQDKIAWLERLVNQPTPAGKGCKDALSEIRKSL